MPINYGFYLGLSDNNAIHIKKIYSSIVKENIPLYGIKIFLGSSTGDLLVKKDSSILSALRTKHACLFHCEDDEILNKYSKRNNLST